AASTGLGGKYYYYKCKHSKHNNISAKKAHKQLHEILGMLSLPDKYVKKIKQQSTRVIEQKIIANRNKIKSQKDKLNKLKEKLHSLQDKFINNQVDLETYDRFYDSYTKEIFMVEELIIELGKDRATTYKNLYQNLHYHKDLSTLYDTIDV